jgi:hypothetical protein
MSVELNDTTMIRYRAAQQLKWKHMNQKEGNGYSSDISWPLVLVVEEEEVPGENHRPWASNW